MKITFTGDVLIYESQDRGCLAQDGSHDYKPIFAQVKPLLDKADYLHTVSIPLMSCCQL